MRAVHVGTGDFACGLRVKVKARARNRVKRERERRAAEPAPFILGGGSWQPTLLTCSSTRSRVQLEQKVR